MSYTYRRFGSQVNVALVAPGQADLAVPEQPQPVTEMMQNYPNAWVRATACAYADAPAGAVYSTVWAWGTRRHHGSGLWPLLVADAAGFHIDRQDQGDYGTAFFAVSAGPLLVADGRPADLTDSLQAGRFTGFTATTRTAQAGVGIRRDGLLVHVVANELTLPELARVLVELGCSVAMRLGAAGGPVYEAGELVHGSEGAGFPCALVFRQAEPAPYLLQHLFGQQEPYRGSSVLGEPVALAEQMESYTHQVNPLAPFYAAHYLELGNRLGLRGDVAYAQALHETDFFRYTGSVQDWQFNFAGIGATAPGTTGAVFAGPREGIGAHLQHLYAYATAVPLPPGMVLADPRFDLVPRGVAPRMGDLNGRWAVPGSGYGQQIDRLLGELLATPARPVNDTEGQATLRALLARRVDMGNAGVTDAPRFEGWQGTVTGPAGTAALAAPAAGAPAIGTLPAAPVPGTATALGGSYFQVVLPGGQSGWVPAGNVRTVAAAPAVAQADAPVVLDPGHGGADTGAVATDGTMEKTVNLAISLAVQQRLQAAGVPVLMTRSADTDVSLVTRACLTNQAGGRLFLSIHHNAASADARGTETYVQGGEEQGTAVVAASQCFGRLLHPSVLEAIAGAGAGTCPPVDRGIRVRLLAATDWRDYYAVLRNTAIPAALLEVAFMSHPADLSCLQNDQFLDGVAAGIAEAVLAWLARARPVEIPIRTLYGLQ